MPDKITELVAHNFTFPQLTREAKPNYQPYLKLSFYFRKRTDISYKEFHEHWETVHADLATSAAPFAQYVTRYTQTHATSELKEKLQSFGKILLLDFDGCSEIWVKSYEDGENFFQSEEYMTAMAGDEMRFMDLPVHVMAGYENLIFGKSFIVGGKDGITDLKLERSV